MLPWYLHGSLYVRVLFFVSGGVALGCEAAYFRGLAVLFGVSHQATGALLAAFMGGLAIGSELGARVADRLRAPDSRRTCSCG